MSSLIDTTPAQVGRFGYVVVAGYQPGTYIVARRCPLCSQGSQVTVDGNGLWAWEHGAFVQDAFPHMDVDQREILITGTHPACWDSMMGDDE